MSRLSMYADDLTDVIAGRVLARISFARRYSDRIRIRTFRTFLVSKNRRP